MRGPWPQGGLSLPELLLALAIVGILASIAYPSYRGYVQRANRVEGQAMLLEAASRQERYFSQNHAFVENTGQLPLLGLNGVSRSGAYQLQVSAGSAADGGFLLSALPRQPDPVCPALLLNALGERGPAADCWR